MRFPGEIARTEYDAHPGERWSHLSHMGKSPLHYQHAKENGRAETTALRTGSALHTLVFEPETYDDRFVVYRESKTKGKGSKKSWAAFQADPDWQQARAASEKNGPLVAKVHSCILRPTAFSPKG